MSLLLFYSKVLFAELYAQMGMTEYIMDAVQGSRINDLLTGLGYRWIVVYFNLTG